jgi:hypothetical protein
MYQTADEAKLEYVKRMGEDLGKLFWRLRNDVTWLSTYWQEYIQLFAAKEDYVALINGTAGGFFRMVQDLLWDQALLQVSRLTDMPGSGKNKRLTIRLLPNMVDDAVKPAVEKCIAGIEVKAAFCRDHRHRRIAHTNLALAISQGATPLEDGTVEAMTEVIDELERLLNVLAGHYLETHMSFKISRLAGAGLLLRKLQIGRKAEQEIRAQIERGDLERGFLYRDLI